MLHIAAGKLVLLLRKKRNNKPKQYDFKNRPLINSQSDESKFTQSINKTKYPASLKHNPNTKLLLQRFSNEAVSSVFLRYHD